MTAPAPTTSAMSMDTGEAIARLLIAADLINEKQLKHA
jgi:hypothetical protein